MNAQEAWEILDQRLKYYRECSDIYITRAEYEAIREERDILTDATLEEALTHLSIDDSVLEKLIQKSKKGE